jgi:transcription initiation factor IIE alpha subunit
MAVKLEKKKYFYCPECKKRLGWYDGQVVHILEGNVVTLKGELYFQCPVCVKNMKICKNSWDIRVETDKSFFCD